MAFTLEELISAVGASVQAASHAVDLQAAQLFYSGFTAPDPEKDGIRRPVTWELAIPSFSGEKVSERRVRVPVVALMSHRPLLLQTVDVRIPLSPCEKDGAPAYELAPGEPDSHRGELALHFEQGDTPEGMARTLQTTTQTL